MQYLINKPKVFYVWDEKLIEECDRLPAVNGRASMVHNLIASYGLLNHVKIVRSSPAPYSDMREFHSEMYLDHLKRFIDVDEEFITSSQDEEYGIGYDCPPVSNMFELVSTIAGGTLTAAKCLMLGLADVAINWCGGWHHAHRFGAEGFCYINDIVVAIEKLRKKFHKVLYIDLDVHHGNGVQDAYSISKSVFTLSFHKYEPGFYPGSGGIDDIGLSIGKGYSCNFPLHEAYSDDTIEYVFDKVFNSVHSNFKPDAIIVQCGADALSHDPHGGARLTARGYSACVRAVLAKRNPTLLLGGGGYKHSNAARLWASLMALVTGVDLNEAIPENSHWPHYGPDYILPITPTLARDANKKSYLDECVVKIQGNLEKYLYRNDCCKPESKKQKTENQTNEDIGNEILKQNVNCTNSKEECVKEIGLQTKEICDKVPEDVYAFID